MSDSRNLIVTSVSTTGQDGAAFVFEDGHRVVFVGYTHGWGFQVEGLRHFFLFNGEHKVVQYDSRLHRAGPCDDENRFVQVAEGYDLERIAAYWTAARDYVNDEYFVKPRQEGREGNQELWFPWILSTAGWFDLNNIQEGRIELPAPSAS